MNEKTTMVKIRLRRVGAKKKPSYRLVVADARSPRDGRFIAAIGHYNPLTDPETIVIDEEKALGWLRQGAQPTEQGVLFKLLVADDDKGRVIGKQGRIAEAMRSLLRVKAAKEGTRASLEIV